MSDLNNSVEELRKLKLSIYELRKIYDKIEDENIRDNLKSIIMVSDNIYKEVAVNSNKLRKIRRFIDYYIITIQKVLNQYCKLKEKNITGKESEELFFKVKQFLPKAYSGFKKMYESLFNDEIIDVDAEIQIMLKESGF